MTPYLGGMKGTFRSSWPPTHLNRVGGTLLAPNQQQTSDYWNDDEMLWDIATKEATAIDHVLCAFSTRVKNSRVDVLVDNQAVIHA